MQDIAIERKHNFKEWLPLIGLACATFIFNTSEFIPIGLLSDIARDLNVSASKAGLLITVYAWFVAIASLPLMLLVTRMESRRLMLSIIALFIVSHIFSALSASYGMLMASRLGVAASHAIFWSIVTPLAVKVAPKGHSSAALATIITGSSIAMIAGLPLGRSIGIISGWRTTFLAIGIVSAVVFAILATVLPKVENNNPFSVKELPDLLKSPALKNIYAMTVLTITGHFTCYSYIEPFLAIAGGYSENFITGILMIFGIVAIIGSFLFSRYFDNNRKFFLRYMVCSIFAYMLLLLPASRNPYTLIAVFVAWGLCMAFFNLTFQSEIIRNAPRGTEVAMSIYSGIYNIGIGGGALVGGIVCTHSSISNVGFAGGLIGLAAMIFCQIRLVPILTGRKG